LGEKLTSSSSGPETPRGFLRMPSAFLRKRLATFWPAEHGRYVVIQQEVLMKEAYKYLYIIAATCLLGVGSGFVTLVPNAIAYEKEAIFLKHKVESTLKIKVDEKTFCNELKELVEECKNAQYLLEMSESYISLLITTAEALSVIALFTAFLGIYLNGLVLIDGKKKKNIIG